MFEFDIDTSLGLCEFPGCSQWATTVTERTEHWLADPELSDDGWANVCTDHAPAS
ncbi:hypothetical protein KNU62_gp40 [Gordonia phage Bakery]|uniref:Uncharacterized protein n=1 Tax=Gordonia phage Bakery TaxID=2591205 RepID=A0A514DGU1_9CAUD|nr:hypothetical protein KNU62_gp40 [Gordonia phage Bakery]QDH92825.1 hypothetical protein SEA_BAKERY_40 [Gordonia phage Bakery]